MNEILKQQIELFNQGISCTKLAKMYNTSVYKIIKTLKQNGCIIINKQNQKLDCIDDFVNEYKQGNISISKLAKKYNLSETTITK